MSRLIAIYEQKVVRSSKATVTIYIYIYTHAFSHFKYNVIAGDIVATSMNKYRDFIEILL